VSADRTLGAPFMLEPADASRRLFRGFAVLACLGGAACLVFLLGGRHVRDLSWPAGWPPMAVSPYTAFGLALVLVSSFGGWVTLVILSRGLSSWALYPGFAIQSSSLFPRRRVFRSSELTLISAKEKSFRLAVDSAASALQRLEASFQGDVTRSRFEDWLQAEVPAIELWDAPVWREVLLWGLLLALALSPALVAQLRFRAVPPEAYVLADDPLAALFWLASLAFWLLASGLLRRPRARVIATRDHLVLGGCCVARSESVELQRHQGGLRVSGEGWTFPRRVRATQSFWIPLSREEEQAKLDALAELGWPRPSDGGEAYLRWRLVALGLLLVAGMQLLVWRDLPILHRLGSPMEPLFVRSGARRPHALVLGVRFDRADYGKATGAFLVAPGLAQLVAGADPEVELLAGGGAPRRRIMLPPDSIVVARGTDEPLIVRLPRPLPTSLLEVDPARWRSILAGAYLADAPPALQELLR